MQTDHIIAAVHITDRLNNAQEVQKILTKYGCNIKTRLGLHEAGDTTCSPAGILILELVGDKNTCLELVESLKNIEGIEAQTVTFTH
jgi:hypothetical protein